MELLIIDANGHKEKYSCDSVTFYCKNGENENDGGSIGIRKGHIKTIVSLDTHCITAFINGYTIYKSDVVSGIAMVENDVVTIFKD